MRAGLKLALLLLGAVAAIDADAMRVERLEIAEEGGAYIVEFEAVLEAPPDAVMRVLQRYSSYPALDRRIEDARLEGELAGRPVLYTRLRGCVGSIFCRQIERYEWLTEGEDELVAEAIPGRGDLTRGLTRTRVRPDEEGTRVSYRSMFEPSFWMPRRMVRSAMRRMLEEGTRSMFAQVEAIASRDAAR